MELKIRIQVVVENMIRKVIGLVLKIEDGFLENNSKNQVLIELDR